MKTVVILVYLMHSTWGGSDSREYVMPDMATCIESVKAAKVSNPDKGYSVTVFCAYK